MLGGTRFIGRHLVGALRDAGHRVTCFHRGRAAPPLPGAVERLLGDRDAGIDGLAALAGRRWDACIDVSGVAARQVQASAAQLHDRVAHYVYVSAVRVYGDPSLAPVRETHPRVAPVDVAADDIDDRSYGGSKVACEDAVAARFPGRCAMLRPQVVVGPGDTERRFDHWVQRAAQGGPMLAPGDGRDALQVIDVRDLARFAVTVVERRLVGAFDLAGPRLDWARFIALLGVADAVWVPASRLAAAGLGFMELPLYRPTGGRHAALMDVCSERARAHGLRLTDPAETLRDVRAWLADHPIELRLSREREAALIADAAHA